ncbi:hypothetical protein TSUD_329480 [Trifolium subterraneum]|uniref:Uncharacterized protein n=1 Tax=Trifolium subterraneum TaxID=3900 RepID=A0A2Z6PDX7_TRISU|nr:hypothetical protein TSUD_329480 [Trifolium subterraneum]
MYHEGKEKVEEETRDIRCPLLQFEGKERTSGSGKQGGVRGPHSSSKCWRLDLSIEKPMKIFFFHIDFVKVGLGWKFP